jgi:hypothetical protein
MEARVARLNTKVSAGSLLKLVVPLLRCEMTDMCDTVVVGLGAINPASFEYVLCCEVMGWMCVQGTHGRVDRIHA